LDDFHEKAVKIAAITNSPDWQVILPYEIFTETITALAKRVGRDQGVKAGRALLSDPEINIVFIQTEQTLFQTALELLGSAKGSSGAPSYFDCLVMAYAKGYQTPYIFGFDDAFSKNGFQLPAYSKKAA
jgi:predicted nucleic acid-binding protein